MSAVFDNYAKSNKGKINKEEAHAFIRDTMGYQESGEEVLPEAFKDLFKAFDKDGNGFIEKDEMIAFVVENY